MLTSIKSGKALLKEDSGSVTVCTPDVRKDSVILLTYVAQSVDWRPENTLSVCNLIEGESFTIVSSQLGDESTVNWLLVNH